MASPDDPDVIVNACESAPYRLRHGVRRHDRFWIKGQPYSVAHMLADDPRAEAFVGGTVYQAFLSALSLDPPANSGRSLPVRFLHEEFSGVNPGVGFLPLACSAACPGSWPRGRGFGWP